MNKFEKLLEAESKFDLSSLTLDGVWFYPVIKQNLFVYDISENKSSLGINSSSSGISKFFDALKWNRRNKPLGNLDFLIVDTANSRKENPVTKKYESLYSDYLYSLFPEKNIATFERPALSDVNHFEKVSENINLIYPDIDFIIAVIKAKLKRKVISYESFPVLKDIIDYLDSDKNILSFINLKISRFFLLYEYYLNLLEKVKPKLLIILNAYNYSNMAFIYAAKNLGIITVELQHGFIREDHPGYIWKQVTDRALFPDYILTYGDYFTDLLTEKSTLFKPKQIFTCGSYAIEDFFKNKSSQSVVANDNQKIIYITSQWSIRKKLFKFVSNLAEILPSEYKIIYKTHPLEDNVDTFYSDFKKYPNIKLVADPQINSLEIIPDCYVHSTAYSTSFMEANYLQKPNIFIFIDGFSQVITKFVDNKTIFLAKTPEEYLEILKSINTNSEKIRLELKNNSGRFYKPDAANNIKSALIKILSGEN